MNYHHFSGTACIQVVKIFVATLILGSLKTQSFPRILDWRIVCLTLDNPLLCPTPQELHPPYHHHPPDSLPRKIAMESLMKRKKHLKNTQVFNLCPEAKRPKNQSWKPSDPKTFPLSLHCKNSVRCHLPPRTSTKQRKFQTVPFPRRENFKKAEVPGPLKRKLRQFWFSTAEFKRRITVRHVSTTMSASTHVRHRSVTCTTVAIVYQIVIKIRQIT